MASTFKSLADLADFTAPADEGNGDPEPDTTSAEGQKDSKPETKPPSIDPPVVQQPGILTLSHDIHLHLPPTSDVSVYRAIFQAMKSELM